MDTLVLFIVVGTLLGCVLLSTFLIVDLNADLKGDDE